MYFVFFIICFLILGGVSTAKSQSVTDSSTQVLPAPKIAKILVAGNRRTKSRVILREMKTQIGDTVSFEALQADQNRIYNLGLFHRIEMDSVHRAEGVHLLIGVTEYPLYIRPFLIFNRNYQDWNKLSYGAGLAHLNFRGRNEKAALSAWAGYDPGVAIDYSNPWVFGSAQMLTSFRFAVQRVRDLSFANIDSIVDQRRAGGAWSIGRRFGLFNYLNLNFGYTRLKFDPPIRGTKHLPIVGLAFIHDQRDLFEYPRAGSYLKLWGQRTGFDREAPNFWRYGADLRGYKKIYRNVSLAARFTTNLAKGAIPHYERVFLGYASRVRGHFNRNENDAFQSPLTGKPVTLLKDEGENLLQAGVELRFPILPWRYFSIREVPAFAAYLQNLKFGLSAGIFVDCGRVWFQKPPVDRPRRVLPPQLGYGAGLHFHLPFPITLLRLELAFDEKGRSERIVDFGVAF
jgi:outer membrane protein assembly factor BamA